MLKIYVVDNGGQWTHREWRVLRELGVDTKIVPNDIDSSDLDGLDGLVLSGGAPNIDEEIDKLGNVGRYIDDHNYPILGICVGAQFIALHFGASVVKAKHPEFGKTRISVMRSENIFYGLPSEITVWENHNDEIMGLPDDFVLAASSSTCQVQGFYHKTRPIYATQFHPEVEHTQFGHEIFKNFISICLSHRDLQKESSQQ
ncbi:MULTISPECIES: GMP synthase subunit A [unclassified Thermoplasma]|uniref:GMP synthase subunit A n=1 Tax=unclassified Thermoplasma TaxID=2684908 RepID=UPI000D8FCB27|nr:MULTISPECIES: GMP synthase subunit A [unclassified Thermoplasma]PYB68004.1 GMP synthase [Thermoplasma sp. Kam2015]